jgi:hypothetical protein
MNDLQITTFCDFWPILGEKKWRFLSTRTNVMHTFYQKVAVVLAKKRQFFRLIFWQKFFLPS